jgi:hypothetical protein
VGFGLWGFCESRKEDVGAINGFTLCKWHTMLQWSFVDIGSGYFVACFL